MKTIFLFKNRLFKIAAFVLLSFVFINSYSYAADYYVSSIRDGRSDNNTGTDPNRPWATFQHVRDMWNSLQPGDTVHLERGSYWEWSGTNSWYMRNSGGSASGGYKTIRGDDYGDQSRPKPIYKRVGSDTQGTGFLNIESSYVIIRDFTIDGGHADRPNLNTSGIGIGNSDRNIHATVSHVQVLNMRLMNLGGGADGPGDKYTCGISIGGYVFEDVISDVLIEGNEISDFAAHGLRQYTNSNVYNITWRGNYVHNNYPERWQGSVGEPVAYSTGGHGNVFEYNVLEDTTTQYAGIVLFNRFGKDETSPTQIRYNIIKNNAGAGIFIEGANLQDPLRASSGQEIVLADIYGNIIYNNKQEGIRASNDPGASFGASSRIRIFNNIFYNNALNKNKPWGTEINEITIDKADTNFEVKNNIFVGTNSNTTILFSNFRSLVATNNLFWNTSGSNNVLVNSKGATYTASNITQFDPNSLYANPFFTNSNNPPTSVNTSSGPNTNGFSLQSSSPAINAGANLGGGFSKAINGVTRSGAWDIGAYEYGGTTPQPSCSADTWEYGTWSSCINGTQTRTATKTFDCSTIDTPSLPTSQSCTMPNTSTELIGWYKMNENSGNTITDSSGKGNTGTINGATWTEGKYGSSLQFNAGDDYAQVPTTGLSASQGSVSLWGYVRDFGQKYYSGAFYMHNSDANWSDKIHIYPEEGKVKVGLGNNHELASSPMNINEWYHTVLTWNNGTYNFYVNGTKITSGNYSGLNNLISFADIGNTGNPSSRSWALNGKVDDVRIYNGAISASDVLSLYNSGTVTPTPSCTEDTWNFGSWSTCSAQGNQTRTATLTYDCPNVFSTPVTSQSCVPVVVPTPSTTYLISTLSSGGSIYKYPSKSSYSQGESVMLFALPNTGYYFSNWSGDISGTSNPLTIYINSNMNIQAKFSSYSTTQTTTPTTNTTTVTQLPLITRSLYLGVTHLEVSILQKILNKFEDTKLISKTGAGTLGKETTYYGNVTENAVMRFQVKHGIAFPGDPGYGFVGPKTRAKLNGVR